MASMPSHRRSTPTGSGGTSQTTVCIHHSISTKHTIHISMQKLQMMKLLTSLSFQLIIQSIRPHPRLHIPILIHLSVTVGWFYCVGIINAISDGVDVLRTTYRNNNRSKPFVVYDIFLLLALSSCRWWHVKGLVGIVRSGVRSGLNI